MRIAFILGAGASAHAGAPLMRDFLDRSEDLFLANHPCATTDNAFALVLEARSALQAVQSKAQFDLRNLESLFGAFEMATLLGLDGPGPIGSKKLPEAMRNVIARTLEQSIAYWTVTTDTHCRPSPSDVYRDFTRYLKVLTGKGHEVAILTFNYDIALDFALFDTALGIDYALPSATDDSSVPKIPLLKLHGSLNWQQCSAKAPHVRPQLMRDIVRHHTTPRRWGLEVGAKPLLARFESGPCSPACSKPVGVDPVIVPPALEKLRRQHALHQVWQRAAAELGRADHIVIVGYSWPAADTFFHHLFALGLLGPRLLRKVIVIDPSESTITRIRTSLVGPQVGSAGFISIPQCFDGDALQALAMALGVENDDAGPRITII